MSKNKNEKVETRKSKEKFEVGHGFTQNDVKFLERPPKKFASHMLHDLSTNINSPTTTFILDDIAKRVLPRL